MPLRALAKTLLPADLRSRIRHYIAPPVADANLTFSQEGEDVLLKRLMRGTQSGFYVDVGAHHPSRLSNTYAFYRAGWRGINIDAQPGSMEPFKRLRPRDINLELAISQERGTREFYSFEYPELNGFSPTPMLPAHLAKNFPVKSTATVQTAPLHEVLAQWVPEGVSIDFFSIDVEGHDLQVLQSNDWQRFRPSWLLVEAGPGPLAAVTASPLMSFLETQGYQAFGRLFNTLLCKRDDVVPEP